MGELLGYARISAIEQNARLQTDALKAAGYYRVFTYRASGRSTNAPSSPSSSTRHVPATPWSCGAWTASVARCAI